MEKIKEHAGVALIVIGTLTLAATRLPSLSSSNTLLLAGLLCIVGGTLLHIHTIKHESNY